MSIKKVSATALAGTVLTVGGIFWSAAPANAISAEEQAGKDLRCWTGIVSTGIIGGGLGSAATPVGSVIGGLAGAAKGTLDYCDLN
jgi:hypothetical protein